MKLSSNEDEEGSAQIPTTISFRGHSLVIGTVQNTIYKLELNANNSDQSPFLNARESFDVVVEVFVYICFSARFPICNFVHVFSQRCSDISGVK